VAQEDTLADGGVWVDVDGQDGLEGERECATRSYTHGMCATRLAWTARNRR
jgi:hypothetical protein